MSEFQLFDFLWKDSPHAQTAVPENPCCGESNPSSPYSTSMSPVTRPLLSIHHSAHCGLASTWTPLRTELSHQPSAHQWWSHFTSPVSLKSLPLVSRTPHSPSVFLYDFSPFPLYFLGFSVCPRTGGDSGCCFRTCANSTLCPLTISSHVFSIPSSWLDEACVLHIHPILLLIWSLYI